MKRNIIWLLVSCVGAILFSSCGSSNKSAEPQKMPPPVPVSVYEVHKESAVYFDEYPASVVALNEVQIRPQVAGYITGIYFRDGQHVTSGQKLYSIDQQQYQAMYNQALANLNIAKANLSKVQQDADRYTELQKNDAIARQTLEHAMADLEASKMQLEAAKANVASVQTNVRYSTITAPFNGTIGISQVKFGTAVSPGQTILNTISSDNPVGVDFFVNQKEISRFVKLQQNSNPDSDSTFTLRLPDQSMYPTPGHIVLLDRAVDPQTGTLRGRVAFANDNSILKPGMSSNIRIRNNGTDKSLLVPSKAVLEQMGEYFVYVVTDSNTVAIRKINKGKTIKDKVIVGEGLQENERIVTEGVQKLRDGAHVSVEKPKSDSLGVKK